MELLVTTAGIIVGMYPAQAVFSQNAQISASRLGARSVMHTFFLSLSLVRI